MRVLAAVAVTALALVPLAAADSGPPAPRSEGAGGAATVPPAATEPAEDPRTRRNPELTARCLRARGAYVTGAYASVVGHKAIGQRLSAAGLNAIVVDFKDDEGIVRYDTAVADLRAGAMGKGAGRLRDPRRMIGELRALGLYVIARVVCFKDPLLARRRPDLAILNGRTGRPWVAPSGARWLDPANPEVRRILVGLARELQDLGIDEVQLDYVRYPVGAEVGRRGANAAGAEAEATSHAENIRRFLEQLDQTLSIPVSVDVFGLTAFNRGDPTGIGQSIEDMAPYVEAITPMLYPANFDRDYFRQRPERRHYDIVASGVASLKRRVGDRVALRPFLQAFSFRVPNFGVPFVADSIRAARDAGADGYLFWNNGVQYDTVFRALAGATR